jgi:hypothetical protein
LHMLKRPSFSCYQAVPVIHSSQRKINTVPSVSIKNLTSVKFLVPKIYSCNIGI